MRQYALLFIAFLFYVIPLSAQDADEDKTLSPYFFVMSNDISVDQLPMKYTSAEARISGVIADVTVRQMYCNEGDSVLEAIYVFPASTRAAVYYMQMNIGDRILVARIKEKEAARKEYEEAREEGKTVSLLEEERPNVFRMNVANILPGDTIVVEMKYTELLVPTNGEYEFVYPTVVGPRYASPSEDGEEWVASPYQQEGEMPFYDFSIKVDINAGMRLKNVYSPSHPGQINFLVDESTASCNEYLAGNKDVVIKYRLSGNQIETGMLLYEGEEENFFLAMVQPPVNPQDYQIPRREYVFIMDVSGSMYGFPISVSKALLSDLIGNLRPQDRFNMIFFAGGNYTLAPASLPATDENIELALQAIDDQRGGGGTELLSALNTALNLPTSDDYARTFVIATDGYVSVERKAFDLIRNNLGNANFFAFGIGSSVNRYIIEGIAHVGMGEPFVILNENEAVDQAAQFREYIRQPVLTNINVAFNGFEAYDVEPPHIPDVFASRPVILFGKYEGNPYGNIELSGISGGTHHHDELNVSQYKPDASNAALRYLWARKRIQLLDDYGSVFNSYWNTSDTVAVDSIRQEVISLGLKYNLLTKHTSFIAVDSLARNDSGSVTTVKQPLPLPEGVSDQAVGSSNPAVYSPGRNTLTGISNQSFENAHTGIHKQYPNPFSSKTTLSVFVDRTDLDKNLEIRLYDYLGKLVDVITISGIREGLHAIEIDFEASYPEMPAGIYHARLLAGKQIKGQVKLVYIR